MPRPVIGIIGNQYTQDDRYEVHASGRVNCAAVAQVMTNTLHGQGIVEPGARVVIDGHAPDDTPEAIYIDGAPGFALGVQWHPEWNAANDPVSRALFGAFGDAARIWASRSQTTRRSA